MKLTYLVLFCGLVLSSENGAGQLSRLNDDFANPDFGSPGGLPVDVNPPGDFGPQSPSGAGRACCDNPPVIIPPPDIPLPMCPGGLPPLFGDNRGLQFCLPTSETDCPDNSACWYNGINYYCCPMESAAGYGPATPAPPSEYGGGGRRPGGGGRPPGRGGGGRPPSGRGGDKTKAPGTLPKGVNAPSDDSGGSNEDVSAPGSIPQGVNPPSDSQEDSGDAVQPPGNLPQGVQPPSSNGRNGKPGRRKSNRGGYRGGGLQPPPFGAGGFPNPFTCCNGQGFQPPSHLPKNINAPSERAIGLIQFHPGSNLPPRETGKAKYGGPIKPDYLWFPGHHPTFTNELGCCGGPGGGPPSPYGSQNGQQTGLLPPPPGSTPFPF